MTLELGTVPRRTFLATMAGAAGAAALSVVDGCSSGDPARPRAVPTTAASKIAPSAVPVDRRRLVVVELSGGNDGLSTLVPYSNGRYHDLRPSLALDGGDIVGIDDDWGVNRLLAPLMPYNLALLDGVGASAPSLSHFDMLARWWAGTPDRPARPGSPSGFLGRLCDRLGDESSLTGASLGLLASPAMRSKRSTTVGVSGPEVIGATGAGADQLAALKATLSSFAEQASPLGERANATAAMLRLDDELRSLPPASADAISAEDDTFAARMRFAGRLLRSDLGVRVIHVAVDAAIFDTHADHRELHQRSLGSVARGIELLLADLAAAGMSDEVLVATTSEFGRRVEEHGGGLDHGVASCALLFGPVAEGIHGDHPPLTDLDVDGNLRTTVSFDRYLATLAAWFDVDPGSVLDHAPSTVPGIVAT